MRIAALGLLPLLAGCASVLVGGALGFDAGTVAVSGVETGWGAQVEVLGFDRAARFGAGPSLQVGGYPTAGDADPVWVTAVEGRWRLAAFAGRAGFVEAGAGLGAGWSPSLRHVAVPLQLEVGAETQLRRGFRARVGVRERFVGLIGSGSPPGDLLNSLQLTAGLRVAP